MRASLRSRWRPAKAAIVVGLLLVAGCGDGPTRVKAGREDNGNSVSVSLGGFLDVILGTTGPGHYVSPPEIAGAAVSFQYVNFVPPFVPGGVRQRFRFRAVARGTSHIVMAKTDIGGNVVPSAYVLDVVVR